MGQFEQAPTSFYCIFTEILVFNCAVHYKTQQCVVSYLGLHYVSKWDSSHETIQTSPYRSTCNPNNFYCVSKFRKMTVIFIKKLLLLCKIILLLSSSIHTLQFPLITVIHVQVPKYLKSVSHVLTAFIHGLHITVHTV